MTVQDVAPHSERMRELLSLVVPSISAIGRRLWFGEDLHEVYPRYLIATHGIIRASVPLMETARDVAESTRYADDPVCQGLAAYLTKHIPEEMHHDDWLLDDLERIGVDRAVVIETPPSPRISTMVGTQYYLIHHVHPVALLGYIALLEGYPPQEELCIQAAAATGYPIEAFRTMRKHAHLDPHHCRELDEAIDSLPLTPPQRALVFTTSLQTADNFCRVMEEVLGGPVGLQPTASAP